MPLKETHVGEETTGEVVENSENTED